VPQLHRRRPRQHPAARLADRERAVLALRLHEPLCEKLPHDGAPLRVGEIGSDPVRRELVVPELADLLRGGAAEDVDEMAGAERLPRSRCSRTIVDSSFCAGTSPSQLSGG
jgi:hypothetical protein